MFISDEAKELRERTYSKYYSPSSKIWDTWDYIETPKGRWSEDDSITNLEIKIQELLNAGYKVKTGWHGNTMRNGSQYFILFKKALTKKR